MIGQGDRVPFTEPRIPVNGQPLRIPRGEAVHLDRPALHRVPDDHATGRIQGGADGRGRVTVACRTRVSGAGSEVAAGLRETATW